MLVILLFILKDVIVAPISLHIPIVQEGISNRNIKVAAQNSSNYKFGAYTG